MARMAKVEGIVKNNRLFEVEESSSSLKRIAGTWELVMVGLLVGTTMLGLEVVENWVEKCLDAWFRHHFTVELRDASLPVEEIIEYWTQKCLGTDGWHYIGLLLCSKGASDVTVP